MYRRDDSAAKKKKSSTRTEELTHKTTAPNQLGVCARLVSAINEPEVSVCYRHQPFIDETRGAVFISQRLPSNTSALSISLIRLVHSAASPSSSGCQTKSTKLALFFFSSIQQERMWWQWWVPILLRTLKAIFITHTHRRTHTDTFRQRFTFLRLQVYMKSKKLYSLIRGRKCK